jgi:HlyD family secretion protein
MDLRSAKGKKKGFLHRKLIWLGGFVIVAAIGGLIWFFTSSSLFQAKAASTTPQYYTTTVRQGDIRISASGSGTLVAATEVNLAFSTSGTVGQLNVKVGDTVTAGQTLAKLKDLDQLQTNVSAAELAVLQSQKALDSLTENASITLATAYKNWIDAQQTYADALKTEQRTGNARCSKEVMTNLTVQYERAAANLAKATYGSDAWIKIKSQYDTVYANLAYCSAYTQTEKDSAQATLQIAESQAKQAEETYNTLQANSGIDPTELATTKAALEANQSSLTIAKQNLDSATMVSPIAGTVISIAAGVGEQAGTGTFITIADLTKPDVKVSMDETDMDQLMVGNKAEVIFDALPDRTFTGTVTSVNPSLISSGPFTVVSGVIELQGDVSNAGKPLMLGLNASVEVISSEATGVLIIPLEALRDLGDGTYGVFVLENGVLRLKVVEIGLKDDSFVEIKSGLKLGDTVSTGAMETKS